MKLLKQCIPSDSEIFDEYEKIVKDLSSIMRPVNIEDIRDQIEKMLKKVSKK